MRVLVICGFMAAALLTSLRSRTVGMLLYWWYALFRPAEFMRAGTTWRLSLIFALAMLVPCLFQQLYPKPSHRIHWMIILNFLLLLFAQLNAGCGDWGWQWTDSFFRMMLLLFLSDQLLRHAGNIYLLIATMGLSIGLHAFKSGLASVMAGGQSAYGFDGIGGTFADSNGFAMATAMTVFLMIVAVQNCDPVFARRWGVKGLKPGVVSAMRLVLLFMLPFHSYNVMALFSRGASLGTILGFSTLAVLQKNPGKIFARVVPVVLVGALVLPMPKGFGDRMSTLNVESEDEMESSGRSRVHFWRVAVKIAEGKPLGVGPGCYAHYYNQYDFLGGAYGHNRAVHSSHFQIIAESGIIGLGFWIITHLMAFSALWSARRRSKHPLLSEDLAKFYFTASNGLIASNLVFLLAGTFLEAARNELTYLTWLLAAAMERQSFRDVTEAEMREHRRQMRELAIKHGLDVEAAEDELEAGAGKPAGVSDPWTRRWGG